MRWLKVLAMLVLFLSVMVLVPNIDGKTYAAPPSQGQAETPACTKPTQFSFPSIKLSKVNGPRYARIEVRVDKDCHAYEASRTILMDIPAELNLPNLPATTTETTVVDIWEQDVLGLRTNELKTSQIWSWNGASANLLGHYNQAITDFYWWHIRSGPTFSNGYFSSSHAFAKGSVKWYCNWSDPAPFCMGPTKVYPMTLNTSMHLYGNGYSSSDGTSYSGVVIPGGGVYFSFYTY